jgi:hypothetical protein
MKRALVYDGLVVVGGGLLAAGLGWWWPPAGLMGLGAMLIIAGLRLAQDADGGGTNEPS